MTLDEAIRFLRSSPEHADLVRDAYLGADVVESAARFETSAEFSEVMRLVGQVARGGIVVDVGAGSGIASHAFLRGGAAKVYAVEPDASAEVGRGSLARLASGKPIHVVDAFADRIPVPTGSVDLVYARQVLHHIPNLRESLRECARLLRPGGLFLACREHVVDSDEQLQQFLANHPVHQLAGGENAYRLDEYLDAIANAGLKVLRVIGPWDSVINAFPTVRSTQQLRDLPRARLAGRLGAFGPLASVAVHLPGVRKRLWRLIDHPAPGRPYSFLATHP